MPINRIPGLGEFLPIPVGIGDKYITNKILYFSASLRGTSQCWNQRSKELRALIQFKINEGHGLPSFFTTRSCAGMEINKGKPEKSIV
jgi:hypothetical protein